MDDRSGAAVDRQGDTGDERGEFGDGRMHDAGDGVLGDGDSGGAGGRNDRFPVELCVKLAVYLCSSVTEAHEQVKGLVQTCRRKVGQAGSDGDRPHPRPVQDVPGEGVEGNASGSADRKGRGSEPEHCWVFQAALHGEEAIWCVHTGCDAHGGGGSRSGCRRCKAEGQCQARTCFTDPASMALVFAGRKPHRMLGPGLRCSLKVIHRFAGTGSG